MELEKYIAPETEVMEVISEGLLCYSNEGVDENFGEW